MAHDLDDIDWTGLRHAYGPADDVPDLIRRLTSADPAEREIALDGLHATIHHQGDVVDSTVAALPFLARVAADRRGADRAGVVALIASIAGVLDDDGLDGLDDDEAGDDLYAAARAAVATRLDTFVALLGDDDPAVRAAAAPLVAALHPDHRLAVELLRRCAAVESAPAVAAAQIRASVRAAVGDDEAAQAAVDWHRDVFGTGTDAGLRLTALAALTAYAPDQLPTAVVTSVVGLLAQVRAQPQVADAAPHRPATPTLAGALRSAADADPDQGLPGSVSDTVLELHVALDDRVDDRIALVRDALASPFGSERRDGLRRASVLVKGWRGPFAPVVRDVARLLRTDDDPRTAEGCERELARWVPLCGAVAADLAAHLAADPGRGIQRRGTGPPGLTGTAEALAALGDERAVPAVGALLEADTATDDLLRAFVGLGEVAAPLGGEVLHQLEELAKQPNPDPARAGQLLGAVRALRLVEAAPAVVALLGRQIPRRSRTDEAAARALGAMGAPVADVAAPALARLARGEDGDVAVLAAAAHRQVTGRDDLAFPVLLRHLRGDAARAALSALGSMTAVPGEVLAVVRELADRDPDDLVRIAASVAAARFSPAGGAFPHSLTPVLVATWTRRPVLRPLVADALTVLGPPPADIAALLTAELASRRRHDNSGGRTGWVNCSVSDDEHLLQQCRVLLASRG